MNLKFALCIGTLVAAFPAPAAETQPNRVFSQVGDTAWQQSSVPSAADIANPPLPAAAKVPISAIARGLEWCSVAVEDPGFTLWGASPVRGDDGKIHLYIARWPEKNVDPAWRKSSEIAHYVGAKPEGPFRFHDVALRGTGRDTWDKYAPHNPEVRKFGDTYALTYIANSDFHQPPHPANQRIGMAVSKSPDGPWRKVGPDGLILGPSTDPNHWTYGSQIVNPTLIEVSGKYHLYTKEYDPDHVTKIYGGGPKIERPKLLMEGGQPAWLYGPSGWNVTGGQRTVVHALRIHLNPDESPLPTS